MEINTTLEPTWSVSCPESVEFLLQRCFKPGQIPVDRRADDGQVNECIAMSDPIPGRPHEIPILTE